MKIKYNKLQITLEIIAALILIGIVAYLILRWGNVPDKIPGHYDAAGNVDRWGTKNELLLMPIISSFLYLLLTVIGFFPAIWNIPVAVTEENNVPVYSCTRSMMLFMKVEALACFFYMEYKQIAAKPLSQYFLILILAAVALTFGLYFIRIRKITK